jgi:hypothetical protein
LYAQLSAQLEAEVQGTWAGELTVRNLAQANPIQHGCLKHTGEYADCVRNIRMSNQNLSLHIITQPKILSLPVESDNGILLKFL